MTNEAQRIAIAEVCPHLFEMNGGKWFWNPKCGQCGQVDVINDLNAMHEAEKVLFMSGYTDTLNLNYWNELWRVCGDANFKTTTVAHATAAQRAEAFLKTVGRWV